jgi:hypothetical protein
MTLYTDLQKLYEDHCTKVVCVNGAMLAKDLRALIDAHKFDHLCENCGDPLPEVWCGYCGHPQGSKTALPQLINQAQVLDMGYGDNDCSACGKSRPGQAAMLNLAPAQPEQKVDERAEFEKSVTKYGPGFRAYSSLNEYERQIAWDAWQARAALNGGKP